MSLRKSSKSTRLTSTTHPFLETSHQVTQGNKSISINLFLHNFSIVFQWLETLLGAVISYVALKSPWWSFKETHPYWPVENPRRSSGDSITLVLKYHVVYASAEACVTCNSKGCITKWQRRFWLSSISGTMRGVTALRLPKLGCKQHSSSETQTSQLQMRESFSSISIRYAYEQVTLSNKKMFWQSTFF